MNGERGWIKGLKSGLMPEMGGERDGKGDKKEKKDRRGG